MDIIKFIEQARMSGKKIVLVNANCHGTALVKFLKQSNNFTEKFVVYPLPAIQLNTEKRIDKTILRETDIFIHQVVRENNTISYELSDQVTIPQLKKSCFNLTIPNLFGFGKWLYPNLSGSILDETGQHTIIFKDDILEEAVKNNACADSSYYVNFFNEYAFAGNLDELFEQEMTKLKERQEKWSIGIVEFMLAYYRSIPMYVDAGHPSKYVMYEIGKQVLGQLGMENDVLLDDYNSALGIPTPAVPCIRKHFGIEYRMALEPRKSQIFSSAEWAGEQQYIYEYVMEYLYLVHGLKLF